MLEAAAELISEIGPTRTTVSDIGERAGYSRSLPTAHFGSKGALLNRIIETVTTDFHEMLNARPSAEGVSAIQQIADTYLDILSDIPAMTRARLAIWADSAASGSAEEKAETVRGEQRFRDEIVRRLQVGAEQGTISCQIDVEAFTTVFVGMLRGVALQLLLDDKLDVNRCRVEIHRFLEGRLAG